MTEQQIQEFEMWLPNAIGELQQELGIPDEIVQGIQNAQSVEEVDSILNSINEQEGGQEMIVGLMQAFDAMNGAAEQRAAMFKKGGKIDYFVNTFAKGGKCCKKACGGKASKKENGGEVEMDKCGKKMKKCGCGCSNKTIKASSGVELPGMFPFLNTNMPIVTSVSREYYENGHGGKEVRRTNSDNGKVKRTEEVELINGKPVGKPTIEELYYRFPYPYAKTNQPLIFKHQKGNKVVNKKNRTVAESNNGLSEWEAKELGIDPNTLAGVGSQITAYPNLKPYIDNNMYPFNKRTGIVFNLGGIESGPFENGEYIGGKSGVKYKVSSIGGQETNYDSSEQPIAYPYIIRYASPNDTIYNLWFKGYRNGDTAYPGIRQLYNDAIKSKNIVARGEEAHKELWRQKNEK